jgi:hypothetical protein
MSVHIGVLYHWSPKDNRESILKNGLQIAQKCSDGTEAYFPWVCLATTPSSAWGLLPYDPLGSEHEEWDLWQVQVTEGDHLSIRGDFAPFIREVRVLHGLPADRVWWVGERGYGPHC